MAAPTLAEVPKDYRAIIKQCLEFGGELVRGSGGHPIKLKCPDGTLWGLPLSPSDTNGFHVLRQELRKRGFTNLPTASGAMRRTPTPVHTRDDGSVTTDTVHRLEREVAIVGSVLGVTPDDKDDAKTVAQSVIRAAKRAGMDMSKVADDVDRVKRGKQPRHEGTVTEDAAPTEPVTLQSRVEALTGKPFPKKTRTRLTSGTLGKDIMRWMRDNGCGTSVDVGKGLGFNYTDSISGSLSQLASTGRLVRAGRQAHPEVTGHHRTFFIYALPEMVTMTPTGAVLTPTTPATAPTPTQAPSQPAEAVSVAQGPAYDGPPRTVAEYTATLSHGEAPSGPGTPVADHFTISRAEAALTALLGRDVRLVNDVGRTDELLVIASQLEAIARVIRGLAADG